MKKIFIFSFNFFVFFLICQCNSEKTTETIAIVDIESNVANMRKINLSEFTDRIQYVVLESTPDHPIARINFLDYSEKMILASDGRSCILYDFNGHFIRTVGKMGRGPGEYKFISNVFLSKDRIYICDLFDLNEYSIEGIFLKKFKNCFLINDNYLESKIFIGSDSLILGYINNRTGKSNFKAIVTNKNGNVRYSYRNYIKFNLESGVSKTQEVFKPSMNRFSNSLYFKDPWNDTLFHFDEYYKLIPDFVFKLGKYKEPINERGKNWDNYNPSGFIHVGSIFQTSDFLILDCYFGDYFPAKRLTPEIKILPDGSKFELWSSTTSALGIYDKKRGVLVFAQPTNTNNYLFTTGLYNDLDGGPRFMPSGIFTDSILIMDFQLNRLAEHIKSDDFKNSIPIFPDKKNELEQLTDSLLKADCDSPVLMFVTFKKRK